MSVSVEEQVLGFEVAVDEAERVEVVEGDDDLGAVKERRVAAEATGAAQVREQLASAHVLEQHVQEPLAVVRPQPSHHPHQHAHTATVLTLLSGAKL